MTLPRLAAALALLLFAGPGCGGLGSFESPCYDDSACENGTVCRSGECVLQCVTDHECPASAPVCQFNRCLALAQADAGAPDLLSLPDLAPLADLAPLPSDAALPPADQGPDASPAPGDAATPPDAESPRADASAPQTDASAPQADASAPAADAAIATDAVPPDAAN